MTTTCPLCGARMALVTDRAGQVDVFHAPPACRIGELLRDDPTLLSRVLREYRRLERRDRWARWWWVWTALLLGGALALLSRWLS